LKKHIPNTITLGNLTAGIAGIYFVGKGQAIEASYCIWLAAILDFLDGFAARLLKVQSEIGKQLDSLADMVTFGVLPALMMFYLIGDFPNSKALTASALFIALFSALRLAKFNLDDSQSNSFFGMPTPACAFFVSSLPFILEDDSQLLHKLFSNPYVLSLIALLLAFLLIAPLRLMAFKFKHFRFKGNEVIYLFVPLAVFLLVFFGFSGIPLSIMVYIFVSIVSKKHWLH
jgi:CDP-diacylglycerol---serine O-phosphatidyltransferase